MVATSKKVRQEGSRALNIRGSIVGGRDILERVGFKYPLLEAEGCRESLGLINLVGACFSLGSCCVEA